MRVATSTNIISTHRWASRVQMVEFIPFLAESGYKILDLNFCEMMNDYSFLRRDDYRTYVEKLKKLRERYSLEYIQSHAPYTYNRFGIAKEEANEIDSLIKRSIEISGELEIPYVVLHAATDYKHSELSLEKNIEWLIPFVEYAKRVGTSIALENLFHSKRGAEYTASCENLATLIDSFNSPRVSACYDFGHAHLVNQDHSKNIHTLNRRITTLHVADNHGSEDEHLLPFYGTVSWEEAMRALRDVGYQGDLTYEVMFFGEHLPPPLHSSYLNHTIEVGTYLIALFEGS